MLAFCCYNIWEHIKLVEHWEETSATETVLFDFPSMIMMLVPVVVALHINTDYQDGTIRNKITVGCSRASIYVANLTVLSVTSLLYMTLYVVLSLLIGIPLFGWPQSPLLEIVSHIFTCVLITLSITALHTLLATVITSRSVSIVVIFVSVTMMFGSLFIDMALANTETILDYDKITYITTENGDMKMQYFDKEGNLIPVDALKEIPNPHYVHEPLRSIYAMALDLNPGGQSLQLMGSTEHRSPDWVLMVNAVAVILILSGAGLLLFQRKDLK